MVSMLGTNLSRPIVATFLALLLVSALPLAQATAHLPTGTDLETPPTDALETRADCAVPCGYITPIITLSTDIKTPIKAEDIPNLPAESEVRISFWWDFDQEGPGVPDDTEEMKITLAITRQPEWLRASLDDPICTFQVNPVMHDAYEDICTKTLSIEVLEAPTSTEDIVAPNNRIMLFATSEEKGTYMKSYGVKDMRFVDDGTLTGEVTIEEAPGLGMVVAATAPLVAIAALALRRRL